jgi:hypothetical protein
MTSKQISMKMINSIFKNVFGIECNLNDEEVLKKFAFDIKLPNKVLDSLTGEETWASSVHANKYIKQSNMIKYDEQHGWFLKRREVSSLDDLLKIWNKINYTTTERVYNSINVLQSDTIYDCENIVRSNDCRKCKNIIFCDGCVSSEFLLASQRTANSSYCIRVDDSGGCSNSYNVICSSKISNSFFIQDCNNLYECMFCSHVSNKRFCISNMQFEEDEYYAIKKEIVKWILNN